MSKPGTAASKKGVGDQAPKKFNDGHIVLNTKTSAFLREVFEKEASSRETFTSTSHLLKKSRNPCVGDITSREDADYLIPFSTHFHDSLSTLKLEDEMLKTSSQTKQIVARKYMADVGKVDALKKRKEILQAEMDQLKKVMEYKQLCIAISSGEKASRTLHPALEQTKKLSI